MYKSILAVSEGGPDAAMSFRLAARIAVLFDAIVDAVHFSEARRGDADIALQSMPFLKTDSDTRLEGRARESERAYRELIASLKGATFSGSGLTRARLVAMGRESSLLLLGRPGTDPENIAPGTVHAALYECARPVVIAPPHPGHRPMSSVVVAWNGSAQAARAVGYALPFLARAENVTILVAGAAPDTVGTPFLVRTLGRHGIAAAVETMDPGDVSGRTRGRALLDYTRERGSGLLVMGAYGHGGLSNFLGLGGATAKVIASCPVPLLLAH
ncbi:MAG: universal stress protein [Reyranella sp.]|uniref:universal stress protein n=1 Tax=Reyranella sp. TaxID=1929291 RepID=UPI001228E295|nr:universal stress protein [Reyranella sp.]TAJ92834.1 MAG: universal stress protein [Reyranella sp.]TBR28172.1 MAG: universal stress protein [Reyranella sp.]